MDKSCDTQLLSPRQVLFLAPASSTLRAQVRQALGPPHHILSDSQELDQALRIIEAQKIEILLFEPEAGKTRSPAALIRLKAADPHLEIVVVAPRLSLVATVATLQGDAEEPLEFDYLGAPLTGPELVRAIERARAVRYLRRSEERGQRAEARMSAVVRALPYGLVSLDEKGTIHDWNPGAEAIFGWSAAEAVGRCLWELALPESAHAVEATLPAADQAAPARIEVRGRRRDGGTFPAVVALARVPLPGRPMFCAIVEDVTEARRMEVELRHAQKLEAVGRLASGLAHEINTPCQYVALYGAFLADSFTVLDGLLRAHERVRQALLAAGAPPVGGPLADRLAELAATEEAADLEFLRERTPAALASVGDGIKRIAALVAAMKDFAQPDIDQPTTIDLNLALESTLTVVQHQASAVGEIERRFGALPTITGLPGDLNQALLAIMTNAIQALEDRQRQGGPRGRIGVATSAVDDGAWVELAIRDDGPGIPEAIRDRIFDPFFTTREVGRGAGQGLSVARSIIVDRHGGTLGFESEVGVGTTFIVRLPVSSDRCGWEAKGSSASSD
jgi:PAS domain S-box-containing protein